MSKKHLARGEVLRVMAAISVGQQVSMWSSLTGAKARAQKGTISDGPLMFRGESGLQ